MDNEIKNKTASGFTLIEIIIVIAILAIVVTIAIPSYQSFVQKAKRSAAKTFLQSIASKQVTYKLDNKTYADTFTKLGYSTTSNAGATVSVNDNSEVVASGQDQVYDVVISNAAANTFTLTATGKNHQASDAHCASFTLNQLGVKGATHADCW